MEAASQKEHYRRKIQELTLLFEISRKLDKSLDLDRIIQPVLASMAEEIGLIRGMVTLYNRQTEKIQVVASYGLTAKEERRGEYLPGEGIIGTVFETGTASTVPKVAEEPKFLNKTGARKKQGAGIWHLSAYLSR